MKSLLIVIFNLIMASTITTSYSASFDCSKAKTKTEKLICSNQSLSKLDEDLNDVYQKQLATFNNTGLSPIALIEDQRTWIKIIRNTCTDLNCLANVYPQRIKDIQAFSEADHIGVGGNSNYVAPQANDVLTVNCDYEDSKPSNKESVYVTQESIDTNDLSYVDTFKKGDKKPQHMRFDVSSGNSASCDFPSGKSVKVKVGEGITSEFGYCGEDPEIFASIWVDQKKVISRRWFAGHCAESENLPLFSLKVTNDKVSVCEKTSSRYVKGNVTKPMTNCTSITDIQKLPIDTIEYPLPGTKSSQVGSIELINGNDPLCQTIPVDRDINSVFRDFSSYRQSGSTVELPEGFEGSTESVYDFNNDGKLDRVFTKETESHYMQGTALLVQFGKSSKKLDVGKDSVLGGNSIIAACQLGAEKYKIQNCPPLPDSQPASDSGFEMNMRLGESSIYFRARYLTLYPFRYMNHNYVGVNSYSQDTMNYAAIIKPLPNGGYEQTCLLRQVLENY